MYRPTTDKAAPEGAGDAWTWTAIDAGSKLIVSYLIGGRDAGAAQDFMHDVAERLANRVQRTTDGHGVISMPSWAPSALMLIAMLVKHYGPTIDANGPERKYSPANAAASPSAACWESPLRRWFPRPMWKSITRRCASK
jgi:hypothetical protein